MNRSLSILILLVFFKINCEAQCLTADAGPGLSICSGASATLTALDAGVGASYTWNPGNMIGKNIVITPGETTKYILTVKAPGGCETKDSILISVTSLPIVDAGPDKIICLGESVTLTGSSSGNYTWAPGGQTTSSITAIPTETSAFILMGTDANGCKNIDTTWVTVHKQSIANAGPDQFVFSDTVSVHGVVTGYGGGWGTEGTGFFLPDSTVLNAKYIPSAADKNAGSVSLRLFAWNEFGCGPAGVDTVVINFSSCNVSFNMITDENKVTFIANSSDSLLPGSYNWDFGDGSSSLGKEQSHIYSNKINYPVTLTFTTSDIHCKVIKTDSVKIIDVPHPTYQISGIVYADGQFLETGKACVFKLDGNAYNFEYSIKIDSIFNFINLEAGNYIIQVFPDSSSSFYEDYLPTFFGDSTDWEKALIINLNENISGRRIHLKPKPIYSNPDQSWNTGTDTIYGTIISDGSHLRSASLILTPNATIYLYNSNEQLLATAISNQYGNYEFDGVKAGTYTIKVSYAGSKDLPPTKVSVDGNPSTRENISTYLIKQTITGLDELKILESIEVFPNPVKNVLNINSQINENSLLIICNSQGQIVYEREMQKSEIKVDTSTLDSGLYILNFYRSGKLYSLKFIKE